VKLILRSKIFLLLLDIIVVCFCAAGIYSIYLKANLPFSLTTKEANLVIEEVSIGDGDFSKGQIINSIDGFTLNNWEEVELYLDGKKIGDKVNISIYNNAKLFETTLTSYYSLFDILIISIVGLFFIFFAILVRIKAPDNNSASLFHIASLGLGMVITMTASGYTIGAFGYGYINRILWLIVYSVTPVLFIHFALYFVKGNKKRKSWILSILYSAAVVNVIVLGYFFFDAVSNSSLVGIKNYVLYYDTFFRVFQTACIVAAISLCIYAYKSATALEERKRLQWLLLGFFIGPFSFVLFWILPILLTGHSLIPESLAIIFLIAIPVTFSIAIVKYHLMDINLLVRRSIVYSIILAAIILTYVGLSSLITLFVQDVNPAFPSILTAITVVVALQPLKTGIQKFVDRKFFRVEYDYREEQRRFLDDIKSSLDIQTLAEKIVTLTNSLIPVDNIGFFILSKPDYRIKMIANNGWDKLKGRSLKFEKEKLKTDLSTPVALIDRVEPGLIIEAADIKVFKKWGMELVFPVKSPTDDIHAFLALGSKKAGTRFLIDDVELLNAVTDTAALAIDRIKLQEDLIREHIEAERLEELNKMKSFFFESITHDLKNPLASIKMFVELLQMELSQPSEKSLKHLKIIDGESDKLRRLIDNILDAGKIEKGMKSYALKKIELNKVVYEVLNELQYQANMKKQSIVFEENTNKFFINADSDAVERALINLLTNAIKYSNEHKTTNVSIQLKDDFVVFRVKDQGQGMGKEQLAKVFEPYYRSENEAELKAEGTGLGLAIVKHIMEAHNGKIEVESEIGKGSIFTLWFPVIKDE
jgi:signal transduction histidine kinase